MYCSNLNHDNQKGLGNLNSAWSTFVLDSDKKSDQEHFAADMEKDDLVFRRRPTLAPSLSIFGPN